MSLTRDQEMAAIFLGRLARSRRPKDRMMALHLAEMTVQRLRPRSRRRARR